MKNNDIKELPNFIDAYGCKIVTTTDIKENTDKFWHRFIGDRR